MNVKISMEITRDFTSLEELTECCDALENMGFSIHYILLSKDKY